METENKELYSKITLIEKEKSFIQEKFEIYKTKNNEDIKKQNSELKKKFEESLRLVEELQLKYENLVESSMAFEEKTRELYKANSVLQENILKLLPES